MTVIKRGSFHLTRTIAAFKAKKSTLPSQVGAVAQRHFIKSLTDGGFTDVSFRIWAKLKSGRASHLFKFGNLKRDIRVKAARFSRIIIGTSHTIYAAIHNFGLRGFAFGRNTFQMPERKFIGDSRIMNIKITQKIKRETDKIFRR